MRVLITGAGGGIGAATARVLHRRGCQVVATARDPAQLAEVPAALRLALDVTDDASVAACVAEAGPVDVLVNNAGTAGRGPLECLPPSQLAACLATNVVGPLRMVQAVLPGMRSRGRGTIVNVSSVNGRVSIPLGGAYSASKYALEALSESLHYELGHFGIRVVIIEPGYIAPGMKPTAAPGLDGPPYDELAAQMDGLDGKVLTGQQRPPPDIVGEAIWEAVTAEAPPLRWPVGADAEVILATRSELDDARFEAAMREVIGLTW